MVWQEIDLLDVVVHVCTLRVLPMSLEGRMPPHIGSCHEPENFVSLFSFMFRNEVEVWFVAEDGGAFLVVALHVAQESTVPNTMDQDDRIPSGGEWSSFRGLFDVVHLD